MIWILLLILVLYILALELYPLRFIKLDEKYLKPGSDTPENIKTYKIITHIHTQFSFDSLGKYTDIKKAMEINNIDYVFITDHNNDDFKMFEDENVIAGVELNTEDGRLLKLGNKLPVISHPNNFEFEHYKWKGDFKEGYLYEIIDIKDMVVWNKFKTGIKLLKNIIIYIFTRDIVRKWNALIPLEEWVKLYFKRASHLKIVGGLDLHVKVVYQERTHGILIPSYKDGFKWLINYIITDKEITSKENALEHLSIGRNFIVLNQKFGEIWIKDNKKMYFLGENVPVNSKMFINFPHKKTVKIVKKDNTPILITKNEKFSIKLTEEGKYHIECYEYDFCIGSLYFGFRPTAISNTITVSKQI